MWEGYITAHEGLPDTYLESTIDIAEQTMTDDRLCIATYIALLLSLPAVATLQLPPHTAAQPRSRRAAHHQLSRGDALRGALAAAWVSPLTSRADEPAAEVVKSSGMPDKIIGEIPASGLIFKDIVKVSRFSDPKVQGVELYVSDFQLPMTERFSQGDIFSDPLSSSVTCVQTGKSALIGLQPQ